MKLQMKPPWQGREKLWKTKDFPKKHLQKRETFGKLKTELFHIVSWGALGHFWPYKMSQKN